MRRLIFQILILVVISTALSAQKFRYKINYQAFFTESRGGIQLIHHDSSGFIIYCDGVQKLGKSIKKIYKLDTQFNITDSILLPNLPQNSVQEFFKTDQGIAWFHDYYNSDSSAMFYEVAQLTFGNAAAKKVVVGKIENWQSNLPKMVGCKLGFSSDQKIVYCYLWKVKSRTEKVWISEITVLDLNLDLIGKTSLAEIDGHGPLWSENAVLAMDTTFYWVVPVFSNEQESKGFEYKPDTVSSFNLHSWHLPSNTKSNFIVDGINQEINNSRLIFDNIGKLHFVGFYTFSKKHIAKGFFDYPATDNKELGSVNKHFFSGKELDSFKVKNYHPINEAVKEYGLSDKYEFQKILYNPGGSYDYFLESYKIIINSGAGVMPMGGGFLAGAIVGAASAYGSSYASRNPDYVYHPMIIIRKSLAKDMYSTFIFPTAQKSKNSNLIGVYQFEYHNSYFFISNESKKNAKKPLDEWDNYSNFTNIGQACITSLDNQNTLKRNTTFPELDQNPAIINIRQVVRLKEKEFFVVVKPDGNSDEHYLGKLTIVD
jgi:hypothetical protein